MEQPRPGARVLIVADVQATRDRLTRAVSADGFHCVCAATQEALQVARTGIPDLVLLCTAQRTPSAELECLRRLRATCPAARVVFLVAISDEELAIQALHAGAERYLREPISDETLCAELRALRPAPAEVDTDVSLAKGQLLVGRSAAVQRLRAQLARVAPVPSNVLISGETGTGKELVAQLIHANGTRATRPLVCVNTAAMPDALVENELFGHERGAFTGATTAEEGKLSAANGGTAFLDEIGDISLMTQAKLLRAIESKAIYRVGGTRSIQLDVRFITATNQDLMRAANEGRFRWDLYYRLNVVHVRLPPLRDRPEDIQLLVGHYLRHFNTALGRSIQGLSPRAMRILCSYSWPGNVRELRNVIEALVVNLDPETTGVVDVPPEVMRQLTVALGAPVTEREQLLQALTATNWNKSKAASQLRCSRMTLYRKMHEFNVRLRP